MQIHVPCLILITLAICMGRAFGAEQLIIIDREITVRGSNPTWDIERNLPNNWTAPVDYSAGGLYIEWEIIAAPNDAADMVLQIGWDVPTADDRPYDLVRFGYMHLLGKAGKHHILSPVRPTQPIIGCKIPAHFGHWKNLITPEESPLTRPRAG